jgi:hypothetical protein
MKSIKNIITLYIIVLLGASTNFSRAQINSSQLDGRQNAITTAVPFLMITPDARSGGMGDVGVAMPNDLNATHWNSAKLPFNEKNGAVSLSYTPWLRALVPDVSLSYLSAYGKINDKSAIGGSLRYFSLGEIQFTDVNANSLGNFNPNELAADVSYAQKLSDNFSVGIAFRYIYSNLVGGLSQPSASSVKPGSSYAGDITCYYKNDTKIKGYKVNYAWGVAATNLGAKITYTNSQNANFIPMNLRVGGYGQIEIDKYNSLAFMLDLNKLMVPTSPIYKKDANGDFVYVDGKPVIESGKDPNVPIIQGMFQSFSDAPGGLTEELREINISTGLEYWYDKQFALRTGYFHENKYKGNRQYVTFGAGIKYNVFGLDVAYLVSFGQRNPLDNTLRFTLTFDFDAFKSQKSEEKKGTFDVPAN